MSKSYTYDGIGRLETSTEGSTTTTYTYDAVGNRLTQNDGTTTLDFDYNEFTAALRLLNRAVSEHPSLTDIVVYDALACNSVFIKECMKLGINAIVRVKKTNNLSLKEVKRQTNLTDKALRFKEDGYDIEVYESLFYMNNTKEPIRYIKYAKEKKDGDETKRTQMLIITTRMDMKLEMLYRIIKARWDIENRTFNILLV